MNAEEARRISSLHAEDKFQKWKKEVETWILSAAVEGNNSAYIHFPERLTEAKKHLKELGYTVEVFTDCKSGIVTW